ARQSRGYRGASRRRSAPVRPVERRRLARRGRCPQPIGSALMRRTVALAVFALGAASFASGQGTGRLESGLPQRGPMKGQGAEPSGLELQLRQKLNRRLRVEVGLSQDQMMKLAEVNRTFGPQ